MRQSLTTQKADALLKSVAKTMCNVKHDLKVANHLITSLLNKVSVCLYSTNRLIYLPIICFKCYLLIYYYYHYCFPNTIN